MDTDVEEQFSPLPQPDSDHPTFSFSESPVDNVSPTFIEERVSPVQDTLGVVGNISVGVSPSDFIMEEDESEEGEQDDHHFKVIEKSQEDGSIEDYQVCKTDSVTKLNEIKSAEICRAKEIKQDIHFSDSFDEPVSEERREKLGDMAFENYAFSEEDSEMEEISKQQPHSAGREISPEDLKESFTEFSFDENQMQDLKTDLRQTGQQGLYEAKLLQNQCLPIEEEMLDEAAGGYDIPQQQPWEAEHQFKRQFSDPYEDKASTFTHMATAQSLDMGSFYHHEQILQSNILKSDRKESIDEPLPQSWLNEPHDLISETHEQTVITSILESRKYELEMLQREEAETEVESAEVAVQFPESFVLKTVVVPVRTQVTTAGGTEASREEFSGEDLFARDNVTTDPSITPVKESVPLDTEVVSKISRIAQEELLQEGADEQDRSISPSVDSEEIPEEATERPSSFPTGKFPMGLTHFGKNLADNEVYESSETGGDTTEEKLSPIEETPTDEFLEEQEETQVPVTATEKRVTFQTDTQHLTSLSSEELIKTSTSSSEMEPTLLAASYDLESGHVSRVVTTYDISPDSVEKQFPAVPAMTKAILSSPEDDVFEEDSQGDVASPNLLVVSTPRKQQPLQVSSSTESSIPSPPAPTPKDNTMDQHETEPDLEGAAIKLQEEITEMETVKLKCDIQETAIKFKEEVTGHETVSLESDEEDKTSSFELVSPTDVDGYKEFIEEYEKTQMLKSIESVTTSSFTSGGEMDKSGQSLEIVTPLDTPEQLPAQAYDKSESSFEHSSPVSSEASEKGSPFEIPNISEFSSVLPDVIEVSAVTSDEQSEPQIEETPLPNGPTEVDYSPTIDLDYSYGGEASAPQTHEVELIQSISPQPIETVTVQAPTDAAQNIMFESNTEGIMESLQSTGGQDRLLMSDQTLYGYDMPSEESGLHSLSTSLLESSVKHESEADIDLSTSLLESSVKHETEADVDSGALTSQGDEEVSDQSEIKELTIKTEETTQRELIFNEQTMTQKEKQESYAKSPGEIYPGKRSLQLSDDEQQKSLEKEVEMEILVRSSEDIEDLLDEKEPELDEEIAEISKQIEDQQEQEVSTCRTDELGATCLMDELDTRSMDDGQRPVSSESYFSQLDFQEDQQELFDLRVDSADLERPITPTPMDMKQHRYDDGEDQGQEDIEEAAEELVDSVIYEACNRVQRDENSNCSNVTDENDKAAEPNEALQLESAMLLDEFLKGDPTKETVDQVSDLPQTAVKTSPTGAKLIRQPSEDIPEITITQHLHEELDSDEEAKYIATYQVDNEKEKNDNQEQEDLISASQSHQIMSQIHGPGITPTCIPEEDEEVEDEILPQTAQHTTIRRYDLTDYGPTCIPEEEDIEDEITTETVSKSSATRPLQMFVCPGADTTDSTNTSSVISQSTSSTSKITHSSASTSKTKQSTMTEVTISKSSTTSSSYRYSETTQSTHIEATQSSILSHDLVALEIDINKGDQGQKESDTESLEEYEEDEKPETETKSEEYKSAAEMKSEESSPETDHFFESSSGPDTLIEAAPIQSESLSEATESPSEELPGSAETPTEQEYKSIVPEEPHSDPHDMGFVDDAGDSSSIDSFTTVVAADEQEDDDENVDSRLDDFSSMTSSIHSDLPEDDSHEASGPIIDWGQQPMFDLDTKVFPSEEKPIAATTLVPVTVKHEKITEEVKLPRKQESDNKHLPKTENELLRQKLLELEIKHDNFIDEKDDEDFGEGPLIEWGPREEEGSESSFESDRYEYIDKTALSIITEISDEDKFEMIDKEDMMSESLSDRHYSSPDYPPHSPGMFKGKSGEKDDISVTSSLLEFERLEREIEQGGSRGSIETDKDSQKGSGDDRHRDDISVTSSLAEFERLERELAQSSSTSSVEKIPSSDSKSSDIEGSRGSLADFEKIGTPEERRSSVESYKQRSETSSMASLAEFEKLEQELQIAEELEAEAHKMVKLLETGTLFSEQNFSSQKYISEERTVSKEREVDNDSIDGDGKDEFEDSLGEKKSSMKEKSQEEDADSLDGSDITSMTSSVVMVGGDLMSTSNISQASQTSQKSSKGSSKESDSLHDDSLMKMSTDSLGEQFGLKPPKDKDKCDNDSLLDQEGIMERSTDSLENEQKIETDSLQGQEDVMQTSGDSLEEHLISSDKHESVMESSFYSVTSSNFSRSSAETMRSVGSRSDSSTDIMQVSKESMEQKKKSKKDWLIDNYHSYKTTGIGSPFIDYQGNVEPELTSFHIDDNYAFSQQSDYSENVPIKPKPFSWGPYEETKRIYTMAEWEAMKEEKRRASVSMTSVTTTEAKNSDVIEEKRRASVSTTLHEPDEEDTASDTKDKSATVITCSTVSQSSTVSHTSYSSTKSTNITTNKGIYSAVVLLVGPGSFSLRLTYFFLVLNPFLSTCWFVSTGLLCLVC